MKLMKYSNKDQAVKTTNRRALSILLCCVYKQNEVGPKGPKCRSEEPESSRAHLGTFLCYLARLNELLLLLLFFFFFLLVIHVRLSGGGGGGSLLPRSPSFFSPKLHPTVPSGAEEDNTQTVTSTLLSGKKVGLSSEHPPLIHRHGVTAPRRADCVCGYEG